MKETVLQRIVLPNEARLISHWNLFWKGPRGIMNEGVLHTPANDCLDFTTYVNGVPMNKWRKYTGITDLSLALRVRGEFIVKLVGYSLNPQFPERHEYCAKRYHFLNEDQAVLTFPEGFREDFAGFEFWPVSECELYGGFFITQVEESQIKDVTLLISTTTCKKEDYIKGNVELLKKEILEAEDPLKEKLYLNVVDNGKTLTEDDVHGYHIRLFPNNNAGGSGGYSRGMIEALHMKPEPTHVLLMDDDVLILPESLRRTYTLLQLAKEQYKDAFVAGAMLKLDAMWEMHEDIGSITTSAEFYHVKPGCSIFDLQNILEINREYPKVDRMYAAWWYCCMPLSCIRKNGLSYPFFIRLDDAEYSLRCKPDILTMSGIGIWHLGFEHKFRESMDYYQRFRNTFVLKDISAEMDDVDVLSRFKGEILRNELLFNYNGVEVLLLAFEDYMKGPKFLMEDRGFQLLQRNNHYNQNLKPVDELDEAPFIIYALSENPTLSLKERYLYYLTINGQRGFTPRQKSGMATTYYDWSHLEGRTANHDTIMAINTADRTAEIRKRDKKRFKELHKRYLKDLRSYALHHKEIKEKYQRTLKYMTSEGFWIKYLKLNKSDYKV